MGVELNKYHETVHAHIFPQTSTRHKFEHHNKRPSYIHRHLMCWVHIYTKANYYTDLAKVL